MSAALQNYCVCILSAGYHNFQEFTFEFGRKNGRYFESSARLTLSGCSTDVTYMIDRSTLAGTGHFAFFDGPGWGGGRAAPSLLPPG